MDNVRLCSVNGEIGYFHCWEHFSEPMPASPIVGGSPTGVMSKLFGIVEFHDRVSRVDPISIIFSDKFNNNLAMFNTRSSECND